MKALESQTSGRSGKSTHAVFVCFGTAAFQTAQLSLVADAKRLNVFQQITAWDEKMLSATPECCSLSPEFRAGRGFGYFWWKPYIIRKALEKLPENALVFYSDCGRYGGGFRLGAGVPFLLEQFALSGFTGVEVPQFGPSARWTSRECYHVMGCEAHEYRVQPQIQATFSLWRNDVPGRELLAQWESYCRDERVIADPREGISQRADFIAHRHDQSVLSNLTRKHGSPYIRLTGLVGGRFLRMLARAYEVNVAFKQTEFVAACLRGRSLWMELLWMRMRKVR